MPFFDVGKLLVFAISAGVIAGIAAGGLFAYRQITDQPAAEEASSNLGAIVTLHAQANASPDVSTRHALLVEAEALAVEALEAAPADQSQALLEEQAAIQVDLDRLTRMVRLESVQPVGAIPATESPALPVLFSGSGRTYLLSDALYEVEVTSNLLVELLRPGDVVSGATVGTLVSGAWRGDGPIVVDDQRAFSFDPVRGMWDWELLGAEEEAPTATEVVAAGVFDLNLYLLDSASGTILKFSGGDYESPPEDWANGAAQQELMRATDLYIDGNIYVLQPDGSILQFFLNNVEALIQPDVQPAFDAASALIPAGDGFFVANATDGRIARIGRDGSLVQQFRPLESDSGVAQLRDVVVDESTGIALLLTEDGLYTTRLVPAQE